MPTEVIIQSSKYLNQFKNDETFSSSTTDLTTNLAGCVMEKVQYSSTMNVSWFFSPSPSDPVTYENLGGFLYRFTKTGGGSFAVDGFADGDTLDFVFANDPAVGGTITLLSPQWMYVQFVSEWNPQGFLSGEVTGSDFYGTSSLDSMIYSFGLIDNNETFNTNSKVSGNNQSFYSSNLVVSTPQVMIKQGSDSDWITGTATITKQANPSTYVQQFLVVHDFIITPFYLDGQLTNLQNNVNPPLYSGLNSLKHVVKADFRTSYNNPNTSKIGQLESILGSTGNFGENMNGFANDYSIVSTTYETATAVGADGILPAEATTIRVKISKLSGSLISTDKVGAFVSYLPNATEYTNTTTDLEENFIFDNAFCLADGTPVANTGVIDSVTATVNAGDIDLVIVTSYTTAQRVKIAANPNASFLLAIQCGDVTLSNINSDRVIIIADALPYDTSPDISGLITLNDFTYFTHDMDVAVDTGFTSVTSWNEDGIRCNFDFDLELSKLARLDGLKIKLKATEATTGESFTLDTYEFILGNIISGGVQQFNIVDTRGYTLAVGSQFNDVTLTTGALVGTSQNYIGTFSQKFSWQEWVQNLGVDQIFYDSGEPNNNFNNKTSNYSLLTDNYETSIVIEADVYGQDSVTLLTDNTTYNLSSTGNADVYNYDEDALTPSERLSGVITTWTADGVTNLGGAILTNGDNTLVKTTWTDSVAAIVSTWAYYTIHRLESTNAQGYAIEELSSINTPPTGQVIQPIVGSTLLDMAIVGSDLVSTSLIDGSTLNTNFTHKLSSRIQSPNIQFGKQSAAIIFYVDSIRQEGFPVPIVATLVKSGDVTVWDYNDGTALDVTNSTNHGYQYTGQHYLIGFLVDYSTVTEIDISGQRMIYGFQWTDFLNVTSFDLSTNPQLTSISNPTTATVMTLYDVSNTLISTLNVSGLTGLGGVFDAQDCYSLTSLTLPNSTETFDTFDVDSNTLLGYFDLTPLVNLTESNAVDIDFWNMALSATDVNNFLVDLDNMSTGGFASRQIDLSGTNAAPDGTSGGFDGTTAKANLVAKNFTVFTN